MPRKVRHRNRQLRRANYSNPYGKAKIKKDDGDNMSSITLLGIIAYFTSCFYVVYTFESLDIRVLGIFKLFCFFIGISFLIPIKIYRKKLTISIYEYIILNIITVAPVLCSIVLFLNAVFAGDPYTEQYKITSTYIEGTQVYYVLENDTYLDKPYLRTINKNEEADFQGTDYIELTFKDGLFGIRKVVSKKFY